MRRTEAPRREATCRVVAGDILATLWHRDSALRRSGMPVARLMASPRRPPPSTIGSIARLAASVC